MKILAIDTALGAVSACVLDNESDLPDAQESIAMERGHAEALLPLIDRVMARVDGGFPALGRVAVTVGPGSFTGLRVGVAAARAIGLACEIPVVGVSTLAAFAAPLILEQHPGLVAVAIDARHGNIYFTAFGPDGRAILTPRIAPVREAARSLGAGPVRIVGSGAPMLAAEAAAAGTDAEVIGEIVVPDIVFVARVGLLADPLLAPPRPLYLKAPDAKPQETKTQEVKPKDHGTPIPETENSGVRDPAPEGAFRRDLTPQDLTPQDLVPQDLVPEDSSPRDLKPQDPATQDPAPQDPAPQNPAPQDSAPQDSAPKDPAPQDSAPQDSAPKDPAPQDGARAENSAPLPLTAP